MKTHVGAIVAVLVVVAAACTNKQEQFAGPTPMSPTPTPSATKSPKPKPPPTIVIKGQYAGVCNDLAHTPGLTGVVQRAPIHWHFTEVSPSKMKMFSTSGGYTVVLDRTGKAQFFGSASLGGDWERALHMHVSKSDEKGFAEKVDVGLYDRNNTTADFDRASCPIHRLS